MSSYLGHIPRTNQDLNHFGVKGMKWGVRKTPTGASRKVDRMARKDAKETARAKMFYGEGAGVRRRQIKATVGSRSTDTNYKKAYEHHLSNQDMAKASSKAHTTRRRKDTSNSVRKNTRGVINIINGNPQAAAASAVAIAAGGAYVHRKGYDKMTLNAVKNAAKNVKYRNAAKNLLNDIYRRG